MRTYTNSFSLVFACARACVCVPVPGVEDSEAGVEQQDVIESEEIDFA
jgi:hypothetical protein